MVVGCCGSERVNIMLPVLRIVPLKALSNDLIVEVHLAKGILVVLPRKIKIEIRAFWRRELNQ